MFAGCVQAQMLCYRFFWHLFASLLFFGLHDCNASLLKAWNCVFLYQVSVQQTQRVLQEQSPDTAAFTAKYNELKDRG